MEMVAGVGCACSGVEIASATPACAGARGLPHQTSHDGGLRGGASQVLACCGKSALPIPAPNLDEGIPLPFWCGDYRFPKNPTLKWCGNRPRGGSKGVIPCFCNLALAGPSLYLCVLGLSERRCRSGVLPVVALRASSQMALTPMVESSQHQKLVRRFCLDSIFQREEERAMLATQPEVLFTYPPRRGITTRSGCPRCRTGSGVSLVSPCGTTMPICHPARPWPSSTHDRTAEPLASPGWALTAASYILMSCCRAAVVFSELLSQR